MIPPQPDWDESRRPSAFCRECECETNHTTREHEEAAALVTPSSGYDEEGGEA